MMKVVQETSSQAYLYDRIRNPRKGPGLGPNLLQEAPPRAWTQAENRGPRRLVWPRLGDARAQRPQAVLRDRAGNPQGQADCRAAPQEIREQADLGRSSQRPWRAPQDPRLHRSLDTTA